MAADKNLSHRISTLGFVVIDDVSNLRFWDAINGEAWLINATEYGHGDLLIEFLSDDVIGVSFYCHLILSFKK